MLRTPDAGDFFPRHAVPQFWADTSGVSYNSTQLPHRPGLVPPHGVRAQPHTTVPTSDTGPKQGVPRIPTLLSHLATNWGVSKLWVRQFATAAHRTQESPESYGLPVYHEKT